MELINDEQSLDGATVRGYRETLAAKDLNGSPLDRLTHSLAADLEIEVQIR